MNRTHRIASILCMAGAMGADAVYAQQRSAVEEIERYRAALGDGNPAELWEARGEALWKEKRGSHNVSLERCDLGLGPGVVKGAYTVLPKYFGNTVYAPFTTPGPRPRSQRSSETLLGPRLSFHRASPRASQSSAGLPSPSAAR